MLEIKPTSQIVFERIVELYNQLKRPVPLWVLYKVCQQKDNLTLNQIKGSLKWLHDHDYFSWNNWHLIPNLKKVEKHEEQQ